MWCSYMEILSIELLQSYKLLFDVACLIMHLYAWIKFPSIIIIFVATHLSNDKTPAAQWYQ